MTDPQSGLDKALLQLDKQLEKTARDCLKLIVGGTLTARQHKTLAKWMFGLMNQRSNIRRRVEERGVGELDKVLQFISEACEVLLEIKSSSGN